MKEQTLKVSVPSRGTGNINIFGKYGDTMSEYLKSFRPLSGNREYQRSSRALLAGGPARVSVPSRGTGNIN